MRRTILGVGFLLSAGSSARGTPQREPDRPRLYPPEGVNEPRWLS